MRYKIISLVILAPLLAAAACTTRPIANLAHTASPTKLHPDLFSTIDIQSEAANFYLTLYNMDTASFTSKIVPLLSGDLK